MKTIKNIIASLKSMSSEDFGMVLGLTFITTMFAFLIGLGLFNAYQSTFNWEVKYCNSTFNSWVEFGKIESSKNSHKFYQNWERNCK